MCSYEMNSYRESHALALGVARSARLCSIAYGNDYGEPNFWHGRAARALRDAATYRRALARLKTGKFSPC